MEQESPEPQVRNYPKKKKKTTSAKPRALWVVRFLEHGLMFAQDRANCKGLGLKLEDPKILSC